MKFLTKTVPITKRHEIKCQRIQSANYLLALFSVENVCARLELLWVSLGDNYPSGRRIIELQ